MQGFLNFGFSSFSHSFFSFLALDFPEFLENAEYSEYSEHSVYSEDSESTEFSEHLEYSAPNLACQPHFVGPKTGPIGQKNSKKFKNLFFHKNLFLHYFKWNWGGLGVSRVTARTVGTHKHKFPRDLVYMASESPLFGNIGISMY